MKPILKILFFVFVTTGLYGQSKDNELFTTIERIKSVSELTQQQNKLKLFWQHSDSLNFGIIQTNWTIRKKKKESSTNLLTLSVGDKIFYHEFYQQHLNDDFDGWYNKKVFVSMDSSLFEGLNQVQNSKYKSDIDLDQLTRLPYRATFGYACYDIGTLPHDGLKMMELVNKGETKELERWLVNINPIKQAYAYLGLKLLQSQGLILLTEDSLKIMQELETRSTLVYSCAGCLFGAYLPIKEQLTPDKVERFIQRN